MATFDQLSADQRAIVELVLRRGQAYADLADTLGMPERRVRELARAALVDLAPVTAARVDGDWQGQLADYILGQQTGPEATATRGHLRRSEPARAWTTSLLDSLEDLYDGELPVVPDGDRGAPRERRRRRERASAEPPAPPPPVAAAAAEEAPPAPRRKPRAPASAAVRRRRMLFGGGGLAVVLIAVIVLLWPIGVLTGSDHKSKSGTGAKVSRVGQVVLRPLPGKKGAGIAVVLKRGNQRQLVVEAAGLPPTTQREAYEVWLYNTQQDARSLGAQVTDRNGNFQGAGLLPNDYTKFRFIDVSREPIDNNAAHSGNSVLRGPLSELSNQQSTGQQTTTVPGG